MYVYSSYREIFLVLVPKLAPHFPSSQQSVQKVNIRHISTGASLTVAALPQIQKTFTTKKADDVSLGFVALLTAGRGFWLVHGILINDAALVFWNVVGVLLGIILCILKVKYTVHKRHAVQSAAINCPSP